MREITGYQVAQYQNGIFVCIVSGMGKNRNTWDSVHSRSAAYRHARKLRAEHPNLCAIGLSYRVLATNT